jgi:hypothetical protein
MQPVRNIAIVDGGTAGWMADTPFWSYTARIERGLLASLSQSIHALTQAARTHDSYFPTAAHAAPALATPTAR